MNRKDRVLPLTPGRIDRHGFEYYRHGTLSLYAMFNTKTGEVLGTTRVALHLGKVEATPSDIAANPPRRKPIHVIADDLSTHKTKRVGQFRAEHPSMHLHLHLHFTPTYSSWLKRLELRFARIERDVITRGVFTSVADLKRKLMR